MHPVGSDNATGRLLNNNQMQTEIIEHVGVDLRRRLRLTDPPQPALLLLEDVIPELLRPGNLIGILGHFYQKMLPVR